MNKNALLVQSAFLLFHLWRVVLSEASSTPSIVYGGIDAEPVQVTPQTSCSSWTSFQAWLFFIVGMWEAPCRFLWDCHTFSARCLDVQTKWVLCTKTGLWARRGGVGWIKERCGKGGISHWSSWDRQQEERCQIYGIQSSPGKHAGSDADSCRPAASSAALTGKASPNARHSWENAEMGFTHA